MHHKYVELLKEYSDTNGLNIDVRSSPIEKPIQRGCCNLSFYEMEIHEGYFVCHICHKVYENDFSHLFNEYSKPNEPIGANSFHNYSLKRKYKHINHFIEVLRRYMGSSKLAIPLEVLELVAKNVNIMDRDAYFLLRKVFKENKLQKYYHEIFPIIYRLGGKQEELTNAEYWQVINLFKMFKFKYLKMEEYKVYGKKSIPSYYMLLDSFLKRIDHFSYYNFPELGNTQLRCNIHHLIVQLEIKQQYELYEDFVE